jgi:hypothetical protein
VKIELFVVTTNLSTKADLLALDQLKVKLAGIFGGLSVYQHIKGYWEFNGKLEHDDVEDWVIYSLTESDIYNTIKSVSLDLKALCNQKSQLFVINNVPYYV